MDQVDALVVGAGVVGLAVARALAQAGLDVVIIEREALFGSGVSSRNSEVIHAGHYYDSGSMKARWCVEGRHRLMRYVVSHRVPHLRCGKLVVASQASDMPRLRSLQERGLRNGVHDLRLITAQEAQAMEPALRCAAALHSPSTGIVDSHALMTALLGDAQAAGAVLAVKTPLAAAWREGPWWRVQTAGDEPFELHTRWLVNAAGLGAQQVAARIRDLAHSHIPAQHLAKGHYFSLASRSPFSRLIYPLPVDGGLGTHLTLDLAGQARFGPDVQWLPPGTQEKDLDYGVDASRAPAFEADIRRWWPALPEGALQPAYSGVRPKLSGPGEPAADFCLSGPAEHGCPGLVNLFGIESPGLTASLALAAAVVHALDPVRAASLEASP